MDGVASCEGYTEAFQVLMNRAGIEWCHVIGDESGRMLSVNEVAFARYFSAALKADMLAAGTRTAKIIAVSADWAPLCTPIVLR